MSRARLALLAAVPIAPVLHYPQGVAPIWVFVCVSACNFDPIMECAPWGGQIQAAVLTVCGACWSSNWAGLR